MPTLPTVEATSPRTSNLRARSQPSNGGSGRRRGPRWKPRQPSRQPWRLPSRQPGIKLFTQPGRQWNGTRGNALAVMSDPNYAVPRSCQTPTWRQLSGIHYRHPNCCRSGCRHATEDAAVCSTRALRQPTEMEQSGGWGHRAGPTYHGS